MTSTPKQSYRNDRSRGLTFRVSQIELEQIRRNAARAGLSMSDYCRSRIMEYSQPEEFALKTVVDRLDGVADAINTAQAMLGRKRD